MPSITHFRKALALAAALVAATAGLIGASPQMASAAQPSPLGPKRASAVATVRVEPPAAQIEVGDIVTVSIVISQVANLYGVDLRLAFDPAVLMVSDADVGTSGVQIIPGPLLTSQGPGTWQVFINEAINATGNITYVSFMLNPAVPITGTGVLAQVRFQAKIPGVSPLDFTNTKLADIDGYPLGYAADPASITVLTPATLVVEKVVAGPLTPFTPWQFNGPTGTFSLPASGGSAVITGLRYGTAYVTETAKSGFTATSSCSSGSSDGSAISVTISSAGPYTCTFTNTIAPVYTNITVTPAMPQGWVYIAELSASNVITQLPLDLQAPPPPPVLGIGSARFEITNNSVGKLYAATLMTGTKLNTLLALGYSTYLQPGGVLPTIQIGWDDDSTDANLGFRGRLLFVPNSPAPGVWQTWNALNDSAGTWYTTSAGPCSLSGSGCVWSQILATYPNAIVHDQLLGGFPLGFIGVKAGSGGTGISFFDALSMGASAAITTYNFDPLCASNRVVNLNTLEGFCDIQPAIDDSDTQAGHVINITAGLFTGPDNVVTINKNQLTLAGAGASSAILSRTVAGPATGIAILPGITGTTISNLQVLGFDQGGICGQYGNDYTAITGVAVFSNTTGSGCQGGIHFNGPVNTVTIDNNTAMYNTSRGIVIWNGFKQNITITNNIVRNNVCCGIELQDGTASGVLISGNTVENNADSGMAATGLMAGAGPNVIRNNIVRNNGRFGIEIKLPNGTGLTSGDGSIVVEGNTVELSVYSAEARDRAGIAAFRRGYVVSENNADIPRGVVIRNNSVTGYQQASTSDGFGIVVEGTGMSVLNNTLTGNDVGVQVQGGHLPYVPNTAIDGNQANLADLFFGRGNSPIACNVTVSGNIFASNGANTRNVGTANPGGLVTNLDTAATFCSYQAAIDAPATLAGHTLSGTAATYPENINVTKGVTLTGDPGVLIVPGLNINNFSDPNAVVSGSIIYIASADVTLRGLTLDGDNPALSGGYAIAGGSADANALRGVHQRPPSQADRLVVENMTIRNVARGVDVRNGFDMRIRNNGLSQIGGLSDGYGVLVFNTAGGWVTGNTVNSSEVVGIFIQNHYGTQGVTVTNNIITGAPIGFGINLVYGNGDYLIADNTVYDTELLQVTSIQAANLKISNNTITLVKPFAYGLYGWNLTPGTTEFLSNTITGGDRGIALYDNDGTFGPGGPAHLRISGNAVSGATVGVEVNGDLPASGASMTATANTISGNVTAGVFVTGSTATLSATLNTLSNNGIGLLNQSPVLGSLRAEGGKGDSSLRRAATEPQDDAGAGAKRASLLASGPKAPLATTTSVAANLNNLTGNTTAGIQNNGTGTLDGRLNWWNAASGPGPVAYGTGDKVSVRVAYCPWLGSSIPGGAGVGPVQNLNTGEWFCTIQAAIDDSDTVNGHTISVAAGVFNETVNVNKTLTLLGAQSGNDGTARCDMTVGESIVTGSSGGFTLNADGIVLDGFVIEGATATPLYAGGVSFNPLFSGFQVRNNVLRKNTVGMYPGSSGVMPTVIEKNCFKDNNEPGPGSGEGIVTDQRLRNVLIDANYFTLHALRAINLIGYYEPVSNVTVSNNRFYQDATIALFKTENTIVANNVISQSSLGSDPYANHGIFVGAGNQAVTITGNLIVDLAAGKSAVRFGGDSPHPSLNGNVIISGNTFLNNSYGVWVKAPTLNGLIGVYYNVINGSATAIVNDDTAGYVKVTRNDLSASAPNAIDQQTSGPMNAECNWYGASSGPGPVGPGSGGNVTANVDFNPWLLSSDLNGACSGATLVVEKIVAGPLTPFTPWQYAGPTGTFGLPAGGGRIAITGLDFGPVPLTETTKAGFIPTASCTTGESGGNVITPNLQGSAPITCTFTNSIAPVYTVITVTPVMTQGWVYIAEPSPSGPVTQLPLDLQAPPPAPILGSGSARFEIVSNTVGKLYAATLLTGTKLNALLVLSYSTYLEPGGVLPTIQIGWDDNNADANLGFRGRILFVPNGPLPGVWQTWNALDDSAGRWYSTIPGPCDFSGSGCVWSQLIATYPNAIVHDQALGGFPLGFVGVKAGAGGTGKSYFDALTIGASAAITMYNFDALCAVNGVFNTSTGEGFCTIQNAIDDSDTLNGHTLTVAAGIYNETVNVNKSLTLLGAQSGNDGSARCDMVAGESIVTGAGGGFALNANGIVLDGFVIQSTTQNLPYGVGVYFNGAYSGFQVRNNVLRKNIMGMYPNSSGAIPTVIERNCFKDNNEPGPASGNGLYTDQILRNASIDANFFTQQTNCAMNLLGYTTPVSNVTVTNNRLYNDGPICLFANDNTLVANNVISQSLAHGIQLGGGNRNVTITGNLVRESGLGWSAVRLVDSGDGYGPNSNVVISANTFLSNTYGVRTTAGALNGPLSVVYNVMNGNGTAVFNADAPAFTKVNRNNLAQSGLNAVQQTAAGALNAECNWYGAANGPGPVGPGAGSNVTAGTDFSPWLSSSDLNGVCHQPAVTITKVVVGAPPGTDWAFAVDPGFVASGLITIPAAGGSVVVTSSDLINVNVVSFFASEQVKPGFVPQVLCSNGYAGSSAAIFTVQMNDEVNCVFTNSA
ncbi:MAG TPA: right-handed parallel beta-helix repeat-containing protein, partial [Thermoflexales bacterium]|nr:right-handed parallel beta-helix repeat-containing protein [Thermoflexales bacterium]